MAAEASVEAYSPTAVLLTGGAVRSFSLSAAFPLRCANERIRIRLCVSENYAQHFF
jgi:hypothetical protein